jgi:hypothetical protein
VGAKTELE